MMNVIAMAVQSVDGYITQGKTPGTGFASVEDQRFFSETIRQFGLVVMGRKTYEVARSKILKNLTSGILRVVLTNTPECFARDTVRDKLEFTNVSPIKLIQQLERRGHNKLLLVGGTSIFQMFAKMDLIDEWHITIEPVLFGSGNKLLSDELNSELKLHKHLKLGKDTLLLKYKKDRPAGNPE